MGADQRLFGLADPRIAEASGLAVGHRSPSVLYLNNDSGDSARFFAVDARTGRTRTVFTVPGTRNVDFEDVATGPDRRGVDSVWLADIGDNDAQRAEIEVYRVDEPLVAGVSQASTGSPDRWRLRYPDGPHDAESLVADPVRHRLYLITKSLLGRSEVYAVPAAPGPDRVQLLTRVGSVTFSFTGTPGGPNPIGQLTATGAAMSEDGSLLVVRSYTDAYLWPVTGGDVAGALRRQPTRLALPAQPQGEGIAVDHGSLLIDSEGVHSAVYRLPLPAISRPTARSTTRQPKPPGTSRAGPATPSASPVATRPGRGSSPLIPLIGLAAAIVVTLIGVRSWLGRRG